MGLVQLSSFRWSVGGRGYTCVVVYLIHFRCLMMMILLRCAASCCVLDPCVRGCDVLSLVWVEASRDWLQVAAEG